MQLRVASSDAPRGEEVHVGTNPKWQGIEASFEDDGCSTYHISFELRIQLRRLFTSMSIVQHRLVSVLPLRPESAAVRCQSTRDVFPGLTFRTMPCVVVGGPTAMNIIISHVRVLHF